MVTTWKYSGVDGYSCVSFPCGEVQVTLRPWLVVARSVVITQHVEGGQYFEGGETDPETVASQQYNELMKGIYFQWTILIYDGFSWYSFHPHSQYVVQLQWTKAYNQSDNQVTYYSASVAAATWILITMPSLRKESVISTVIIGASRRQSVVHEVSTWNESAIKWEMNRVTNKQQTIHATADRNHQLELGMGKCFLRSTHCRVWQHYWRRLVS